MLHRSFQPIFVNSNDVWVFLLEKFHMQLGFHRKIHRLLLASLILTSIMIFWYINLVHTPFFYKTAKSMRSEVVPIQNNTEIVNGKIVRKTQSIILHTFTGWISYFAQIFTLSRWHLLTKYDLQKIPLMMNFTANITDETLFVYKAFLDLRQNEPLIRVLAFSKCHDIKILLHYGSHCISGKDVTIEYDCPWKWVPECKWFSFMLIFNMKFTNFSVDTKEIIVTKGEQMVSIPLVPLPRYHQDTLHVCVPPLYWYWNYVAFIQFIEIWRMQGASMFYIYYVSVNRHVMDILKIYEKMGIIRLIRWQMMPRSEKTDPNRWIYRFGHTLSMNDCLYTSSAKYVALVDIDEFIFPNSGRLLPFLRKMHNSNNVAGSFVFEHARVRFQGWNILKLQLKLDFNWLKNAEFQIQEGPSKTVFMPERVQIVVTHKVRQFLKSHRSMKIDTKDGLLYHARSNWIFTTLNDSVYHPTDIFHGYITSLNSAYEKIMSLVSWPEWNLVPAWKMLSKRIEKCTSKWRMYGCKAPHHLCWNALNDQDNWIFSHVNTSSHYILL